MKRTSIIIVNYNKRKMLEDCIQSVQTFCSADLDEIIIVDNGSKKEKIIGLSDRFLNVTFLFLEKNIGFGRANNYGAAHAKGEYLLFLNNDAFLIEDVIHPLQSFLKKHPEAIIAAPKLLFPDKSHQPSTHGYPSILKSAIRLFPGIKHLIQDSVPVQFVAQTIQRLFPGNFLARYELPDKPSAVPEVTGACFMISKKAFLSSGGFDPCFFMYFEEADLCYRINHSEFEIYFVPNVSVIHKLSKKTIKTLPPDICQAYYQSLVYFFYKNKGPLQTSLLRLTLICLLGVRIICFLPLTLFKNRLLKELKLEYLLLHQLLNDNGMRLPPLKYEEQS